MIRELFKLRKMKYHRHPLLKVDAAIPDWSFDRIGYDKSVPKCQVVKLIDRHVEPGSNLREIDLSFRSRTRFDICIGTRT